MKFSRNPCSSRSSHHRCLWHMRPDMKGSLLYTAACLRAGMMAARLSAASPQWKATASLLLLCPKHQRLMLPQFRCCSCLVT